MAKNQFEKESCEVALEKDAAALYAKYLSNFDALKPVWKMCDPIGYTYHGKAHVEMVVQYVGRLLGSDRIAGLANEELFILLMGALCHDVGMRKCKRVGDSYITEREDHNINSYLSVYDPEGNEAGDLKNIASITMPGKEPKYNELIALLCLGHRDHEENNKKICTLTEESTISGKKIKIPAINSLKNNTRVHTQYLASILRLADEIDVTNQRAPRDVEMYLKDFITDEAKEHWCAHQLIEAVQIDHNPAEYGVEKKGITDIWLTPDKNEITARSKEISKKQLLRLVFSRRRKIEEEIRIVNGIASRPPIAGTELFVEYHVKIEFDNEVVTLADFDEYQKDVARQKEEENRTSHQKAMDDSDSSLKGRAKKKSPIELFNDEVIRLKRDSNLLETGSFKFSFEEENEYTQYFINTQKLLTNRSTLDSITEIFKDYYCKKNIDCVIGIGKAGIILAPNLSLKLNCDSSYWIGKWEDSSSVKWEKITSVIKTAKNVLVLLDVISTGTATKHCLKEIKENNESLQNIFIGAVFCTNKTIKGKIEEEEKVKELFSIIDDFQYRTYSQKEYEADEKFKKEFELLPLRRK